MTGAHLSAAEPDDAMSIAAVHVASWRETYAGLLPDIMLANLHADERVGMWAKILDPASGSAVWKVEVGEQIVGFASCGPQRDPAMREKGFDAEVSAIYILRSQQRVGLGTALMDASAQSLQQRGYGAAMLWVLNSNESARGFYARLGGVESGMKIEDRAGVTLTEIAYGWKDLAALRAAP